MIKQIRDSIIVFIMMLITVTAVTLIASAYLESEDDVTLIQDKFEQGLGID